ncbi:MAG: NAD/FAD-binding protein [Actinobacteria bacterium HGW-Actinobacteria-10]|jgi:predicted NAD/FAD-binding protein|nr:MAG: NAD/FAD-binding protein [Actinobacteria bacterium HGW-Actinobacteria-10]
MKIAVIGAGIGGISSAWLLSQAYEVDLFEAEENLGGHTLTIDVDTGSGPFPVDTGFQVFNRRTYPNLTRFFEHLGIDASDADMSFSVQIRDAGIEWSGTSLDTVFAQRKNLANPKFLRMLADVLRLSRDADKLLADPSVADLTLGELMKREGYSDAFTDWYLIPMGDAIWSTPPGDMLDYPALTFLRFCDNHGLLHVTGKPMWLSVRGGARRYVQAAIRSLSGEVFDGTPVERVERTANGVRVHSAVGVRDYDVAVLATHPPETRAILGDAMTPLEREILGAFNYWDNDVVVHTDESFMPSARRAWASWNWYSESSDVTKSMLMLTYHINTLQELPQGTPTVMETLNRDREPTEGTLLRELTFRHPMYSRDAVAAQERLGEIQGVDRLWFAGAWTRYGFHEDGILSGVRVAEELGATLPWGDQLDATRTQVRHGAPVPMLGQTRKLMPGEAVAMADEVSA